MEKEVCVAVTGAAGQIGYSLLFRLASGEVFGKDRLVKLKLLELPQAVKAATGVAMELDDCAFPSLSQVDCYSDPEEAFSQADWVLMVGASPRGPGMERADLIRSNGPIFKQQGKALSRANSKVNVVVVGNPCNTNALIALSHAQEIPKKQFTAMTALDEGRARALLAQQAGCLSRDVTNLVVWGNHSTTMYPNFELAQIKGRSVLDVISDRKWLENDFLTRVQKRGAEIISVRGKSSAASAASACIDHIKNMVSKTDEGKWFSAAVLSPGGVYGVPKGVMFSFPLCSDGLGGYKIVENLVLSDFAKEKLKTSWLELEEERKIVKDLL